MIDSLIKIMIGFFLSFLILILIPQIYNGIYGEHTYLVILWLLFNFVPHAMVLIFKKNSIVVKLKKLIYSILIGYYLLMLLSVIFHAEIDFAIQKSNAEFLVQSLGALLLIQLIFIFIIFYATISNEIPTPYDTVKTSNLDTFSKQLKELIGDNQIEQALNLSFDFYREDRDISNHLILLKKRLKAINIKESMGIASFDDAEIERNRVSKALLEVATPK